MAEELIIVSKERVCIGNRFNAKDKVEEYWMNLDEQGNVTGNSFSFTKPVKLGSHPGSVYKFFGTEDADGFKFWMKGEHQPQYVRQYKDRAQIIEWEIAHQKTNIIKTARAKKAKLEPELLKALKPIKDAYQRTNFEGRSALLAIVIREITKP